MGIKFHRLLRYNDNALIAYEAHQQIPLLQPDKIVDEYDAMKQRAETVELTISHEFHLKDIDSKWWEVRNVCNQHSLLLSYPFDSEGSERSWNDLCSLEMLLLSWAQTNMLNCWCFGQPSRAIHDEYAGHARCKYSVPWWLLRWSFYSE